MTRALSSPTRTLWRVRTICNTAPATWREGGVPPPDQLDPTLSASIELGPSEGIVKLTPVGDN